MRKLLSEKWGVIILCWFVYTCSYIGKMGYSANIIQIEKTFDVSHATAGIVSTCFFFAYGAGQIINGIFCKKYNVKYVIFFSLLMSGVCNLLMGILQTFVYQKYIWFINGATLSVLWPSLIRYLSERLKKEEMSSAVVAMGTTVAVGTAAVYGLSALFAEFLLWLERCLLVIVRFMRSMRCNRHRSIIILLCRTRIIQTLQKRRYLCAFLQILGRCTYSTTVLAFATNHQKYRRFCCRQV